MLFVVLGLLAMFTD